MFGPESPALFLSSTKKSWSDESPPSVGSTPFGVTGGDDEAIGLAFSVVGWDGLPAAGVSGGVSAAASRIGRSPPAGSAALATGARYSVSFPFFCPRGEGWTLSSRSAVTLFPARSLIEPRTATTPPLLTSQLV